MNATRAVNVLNEAIKALENGDSNTATRHIHRAMAEIRDEICDDCEEVYELCECGTDPEDYPEDTFRAAEALIDSTGLEDAVSIMADICHEKAEHILSNWQDEILAKRWSCAAKFLEQAAQKIKLLAL